MTSDQQPKADMLCRWVEHLQRWVPVLTTPDQQPTPSVEEAREQIRLCFSSDDWDDDVRDLNISNFEDAVRAPLEAHIATLERAWEYDVALAKNTIADLKRRAEAAEKVVEAADHDRTRMSPRVLDALAEYDALNKE